MSRASKYYKSETEKRKRAPKHEAISAAGIRLAVGNKAALKRFFAGEAVVIRRIEA